MPADKKNNIKLKQKKTLEQQRNIRFEPRDTNRANSGNRNVNEAQNPHMNLRVEGSHVAGNIQMIMNWIIQISPKLIILFLIVSVGVIAGGFALSSLYTVDRIGNTVNPSPIEQGFTEVQPPLVIPANASTPVVSPNACVTAGQELQILTSGTVVVGQMIGATSADGSSNPLGGLGNYDIVDSFLHGALMCRINGETAWQLCGATHKFMAQTDGCIEFLLNDNDPGNNSGEFTARIAIK